MIIIVVVVPKIQYLSKAVVPLSRSPYQRLFGNDLEYQYFKVYAGTTGPNLGEYLDKPIWSSIALQACEEEYFIKHAVIALGALNKSHDVTTAIGEFSGNALVAGSTHYQVAFHYYGKSLQGIRTACQEERKSRRTILIACLLSICFEYYNGNIDLAIAHVKNGIRLSK
jgi:Fungal specific transcription factor domain